MLEREIERQLPFFCVCKLVLRTLNLAAVFAEELGGFWDSAIDTRRVKGP